MAVAQRIKEIVDSRGITYTFISSKTGISIDAISRSFSGKRRLSADEMAKIGLLCLKNGIFNNKRIVSEKWLEESFMVRLCCGEKFRDMKYGYLWWIIDENEGSYAAIGNSGNVIYINHRKDLVVAVSSYFKPTIFDRIDFIKEQIEEKFETERKVKTVK